MSNLGIGAMLKLLAGNRETVEAVKAALGKTIAKVEVTKGEERYRSMGKHPGESLLFTFTDGSWLKLWDDGQSCCEYRHMTCDDDLAPFEGAELRDLELRDGPRGEDEHGEAHDQQFLVCTTSKGAFTVANHNEHNGYYGGFAVEARLEKG